MTRSRLPPLLLAGVWWVLLMAATLALRPLTPVDETRYVTVAWEMLRSGDFIVPHLNGALYSHKPPLIFWLMNAGWAVFGVNEWWPRLAVAAFSLGGIWLTARLADLLWPGRRDLRDMAALIAGGAALWVLYTTTLMFDLMLTFFTLTALVGVLFAWREGGWRGWVLVGVGLGLGILAKGPVVFLHVLPPAVLAPWWAGRSAYPNWGVWYRRLCAGVLLGAAIALAWAVPAMILGGEAFRYEILWYQSAHRMVNSFSHVRPLWWYVPFLPVLLFPWLFWLPFWKGVAALARGERDTGVRFALACAVPAFVVFSLMSGKQVHYLLPDFPAFALLAAAGLGRLSQTPGRGSQVAVGLGLIVLAALIAVFRNDPRLAEVMMGDQRDLLLYAAGALALIGAGTIALRPVSMRHAVAMLGTVSVLMVVALELSLMRAIVDAYDMKPIAQRLAQIQAAGQPIAHHGKYHGQYQFMGRLERPLTVLALPQQMLDWARQHPDGSVVVYSSGTLTHPQAMPQWTQRYRGKRVYVWRAADLAGVSRGWMREFMPPGASTDN